MFLYSLLQDRRAKSIFNETSVAVGGEFFQEVDIIDPNHAYNIEGSRSGLEGVRFGAGALSPKEEAMCQWQYDLQFTRWNTRMRRLDLPLHTDKIRQARPM